ncbi:MAG TPA: FAD-linked oxidase C-terminal domain-containing protein [Polyangiaceae bacterium]|nr:FAD-linked oxidase C-terminal domain-containing protein [Polyangiaceae bacterium]
MKGAERLLQTLSRPLRVRSSVRLSDRIAGSRDLWQRRLLEVQHGRAVVAERLPAAVLRPQSAAEVREIIELARREGLGLVPYGAGSGVCGAIECGPRTLVVDTKRMRDFSVTDDGTLKVGPGALGIALEETLARRGLTIGHFPSSILCSTVGGWVAARGAGQCSGRYGKIEDMLVSATAVLASGATATFKRRRAGLDLLPLLVGSEGTLGIFTELELRLHAAPPERAFLALELPTTSAGMTTLRRIYQSGLRPAVARLYDPLDSALLGRHRHEHAASTSVVPWDAERYESIAGWLSHPTFIAFGLGVAEKTFMRRVKLVFVFEGEVGEAHEDAERALGIAREHGGSSLGAEPAERWFERRYAVSYDQSLLFRQGAFSDTMEVAAPWSRLEELYDAVRRVLGQRALVMAHLSHAYPDGCSIYFTFVAPSPSAEVVRLHESLWREALAAVHQAGGTIGHHHGIGRLRAEALGDELGPGGLELLSRVKHAFDPDGLLCPGSPLGPPRGARRRFRSGLPEVPEQRAPGDGWHVDVVSGLARAPGDMPLSHVERALEAEGRTLGLEAPLPELDVKGFVARGLPGMPDAFADPVGQRVAGFGATALGGVELVQRPAPRRATGPDLAALFVGAGGRFGSVGHAWLPAPSRTARPPRKLPFRGESSAALTDGEKSALEALARAMER